MRLLPAILVVGLAACQTTGGEGSATALDALADDAPETYEVDGVLFPTTEDIGVTDLIDTSRSSDTPSNPPSDAAPAETTQSADGADSLADGSDGPSCVADCVGKDCGDDGCGGSCGGCSSLSTCEEGVCIEEPCVPLCGGRYCGFDGCGGVCGFCSEGTKCEDGQCVTDCSCEGKECGDDGCGLVCGVCDTGYSCVDSACEVVTGDATCTQILACIEQCDPQDALCDELCVGTGSTIGQYEHLQYTTCLENHGCEDLLCLAEYCATETALCQYATSGTWSCQEIVACQDACAAGDQACIDACIPLGSIDGQAEYISLVYCVQGFCPPGSPSNCVNLALSAATLCADYYTACIEP